VLPDGIFSKPKNPNLGEFWKFLRCWYFCHLVYLRTYFATKRYILWPFGTFCGQFVYFSRFGMFYREKSGNPAMRRRCVPRKTVRYLNAEPPISERQNVNKIIH
jgi:hypothetical protein